MQTRIKLLWIVIGLLAVLALLVMTGGCTGTVPTSAAASSAAKPVTSSVPATSAPASSAAAPAAVSTQPKPSGAPAPGDAQPKPSGAPAPGGAQPKPSGAPAPGGASNPAAGGASTPAAGKPYTPVAVTVPAPSGVFTTKASGTYYGPGKSPSFAIKIPANKNANGDWAACEDDGTLPIEYTCNGSGQSPPLEWSGEPVGTKEYALVVWHKPSAELGPARGPKVYWVVYGIPANVHSLKQNNADKIGMIGLNEKNNSVFEPSCSAGTGLKTYLYTLYALDDSPQWSKDIKKKADGSYEGVTREVLLAAIKDNTLDSTTCRVNTDVGNLAAQAAGETKGSQPPPGGGAGGAQPPPAGGAGGAQPPPAGGAGGAQPPPAGGAGGAQPPPAGGAGGAQPPPAGGAAPTAGTNTGKAIPAKPASSGKLVVTSTAVKEAGNMPDKYTRTGAKAGLTTVSPPIAWSGSPADAKSFVVILNGTSTDGFEEVHWILYNIPGTTASLAEAVTGVGTVGQAFITPSEGAMGTYKKTLTVYALSTDITVAAADKADVSKVRAAMEGKILDTGSLNYEFTVG